MIIDLKFLAERPVYLIFEFRFFKFSKEINVMNHVLKFFNFWNKLVINCFYDTQFLFQNLVLTWKREYSVTFSFLKTFMGFRIIKSQLIDKILKKIIELHLCKQKLFLFEDVAFRQFYLFNNFFNQDMMGLFIILILFFFLDFLIFQTLLIENYLTFSFLDRFIY